MAMEIVDGNSWFTFKKMVVFHSYGFLPGSNPNLDDPNVEPMATKNVTFTFDMVDVPVGTAVDSDTVRQLLRRDPAPTFSQAAILVRSAALGYGTAGPAICRLLVCIKAG